MVVYLVTSIFETEPGQFKKYTMAYDSLDAALEYVELDMAAQYEGIYKDVLTDDIKELIRMREDFFFKYGTMPHYIMIERLDVLSALPENVDNVVRFSLTEHVIEPVEEGEETEDETDDETDEEVEEESEPNINNSAVENKETNLEFTMTNVPEENMNEVSSTVNKNEESESAAEDSVENVDATENLEENTIGVNSESDIDGLDEEETSMPSPETIMTENMGSNMGPNSNNVSSADETSKNDENIEEPTSTSAAVESNIPAALRTSLGGKRRTRRKTTKGKNKSRKA